MQPTITLIIPQALEPLSLWQRDFGFKLESTLFKTLFNPKYLNTIPVQGIENTIGYLAGLSTQSLSIAAWRYAVQFGELPKVPVLCADLVKLESGLDCVKIVPHLPVITPQESERVAKVLNPFLAQDNCQWLEKDNYGYLLLEKNPTIQTTAISEVLGQNIFPFLPQGEKSERIYWHRLLNEIQMLLHQPSLGQSTTQDFNGIWLWGNGESGIQYESTIQQLIGNSLTLEAMAYGIKAQYSKLSNKNISTLTNDTVIVLDQLILPALADDISTWQSTWTDLEKGCLEPVLALAKQNKIKLQISTGNQNLYQIVNKPFWRFW